MTLSVSVIIPTYNYGRFIGDAVESVLSQTYPIAEIIVVDDGSTDETETVITKFGKKVHYIKQKNAGVGVARNNGARNAVGNFIGFLDADDLWLPEKIEKQIARFLEDDEIGLVHCGVREFDTNTGETIDVDDQGKEGWVLKDLFLFEEPVICGPGSTSLIRRQLFIDVGEYDADRHLHPSEDWELSVRLARKCKFGFVPEVLVDYRNHGINAHLNPNRMERSMRMAWKKAFSIPDEEVRRLRSRSYGNLHKALAGSYLMSGQYGGFIRNLIKSLWFRPSFLLYYLRLPFTRRNKS